jgi:Domain of unknown function (DUF4417)
MLDSDAINQDEALKDRPGYPALLGCVSCVDRGVCGGLHVPGAGAVLSCLSHCTCSDSAQKARCDVVCPNAPQRMKHRVIEIRGFTLDNIPPAPKLKIPPLPDELVLFNRHVTNQALLDVDWATIPFSKALVETARGDSGKSAAMLTQSFRLKPTKGWILSGVEVDSSVERSWKLPNQDATFRKLAKSGVKFATTPNFSLFSDAPRQDNMHAMKRIAMIWHSLQSAGIPTALHVNGRTEYDFERWGRFIETHPEVAAIAFEFLTLRGGKETREVYVNRLERMAEIAGRDLTLVVRGEARLRDQLARIFKKVVLIDATPCIKTIQGQRALKTPQGKLHYFPAPTENDAERKTLFEHNRSLWQQKQSGALLPDSPRLPAVDQLPQTQRDLNGDNKSSQSRLFANDELVRTAAERVSFQTGVVTAHT